MVIREMVLEWQARGKHASTRVHGKLPTAYTGQTDLAKYAASRPTSRRRPLLSEEWAVDRSAA
jgi:hypothetical protein